MQGSPLAPTWSPDGTAVAFVLDEQTLWRVQAAGGAPTKLCDLPVGVNVGLAWRADRTIVLYMSQGPGTGSLFAVPEGGERPAPCGSKAHATATRSSIFARCRTAVWSICGSAARTS